ncbi:MAG TPA: hypothetical protein VFW09_16075 [Solirubrobacteraceae bacterium]|nr:hypothetical protein [Solirubrobacteraceae bacterium]
MDRDRERLLAANEGLARRINEAIESGQWPGEQGERTAYRCECAQLDCKRLVELTPAEYEQVRARPHRFLVFPGHERPEVETVIEATPAYVVVAKGGAAGAVAEATDPRD